MSRRLARARRFLRGGGGIIVGTAVMNVCTFGFTVVAAGILDSASYGAYFALLNLLMVIAVMQMGLQATAARRIVADPASVATIERAVLRAGHTTGLVLAVSLVVLSPGVAWLLQLDSVVPALVLALLAHPITLMGAQVGILQGEKRWVALSWVYVMAGVPRIAGLALLWWRPTETMALIGTSLGYLAPVVLGWWLLRRPREVSPHAQVPAQWPLMREAIVGAQALLAFFTLANLDIVVARHVLSDAESGLYAFGLLVTKTMLFLPQFVVIVMFPSLATVHQRRRAVIRGTTAILALGAMCTLGVAVLSGIAADLLHSEKLDAVAGHLWLFSVLGTLLSIIQLLVYATLARRGRRSITLVWVALATCAALGLMTTTPTGLLTVMITVTTALAVALMWLSLRVDAQSNAGDGSVGGVVPAAADADRDVERDE